MYDLTEHTASTKSKFVWYFLHENSIVYFRSISKNKKNLRDIFFERKSSTTYQSILTVKGVSTGYKKKKKVSFAFDMIKIYSQFSDFICNARLVRL